MSFLLWDVIAAKLRPSELPEAELIIGEELIERNQDLVKEIQSLESLQGEIPQVNSTLAGH